METLRELMLVTMENAPEARLPESAVHKTAGTKPRIMRKPLINQIVVPDVVEFVEHLMSEEETGVKKIPKPKIFHYTVKCGDYNLGGYEWNVEYDGEDHDEALKAYKNAKNWMGMVKVDIRVLGRKEKRSGIDRDPDIELPVELPYWDDDLIDWDDTDWDSWE